MEGNTIPEGYEFLYTVSDRVNYTDPVVRHDPIIEKQVVPKPNITDDIEQDPSEVEVTTDVKKIEGVSIPIVLLNNTVLNVSNINTLVINYDGVVPTIKLIVSQQSNEIEFSDSPGLDNIITVVMTPRVNGAYKPISINFYINSVKKYGTDLYYIGTYKLLELEQNKTEQIIFPGCQDEFCGLDQNDSPTTYEFLHEIAIRCGLGYATTDEVKEISDNKYRFITNQTYKTAIEKHVNFAGLDEYSIFDWWIDLYRYLVVINVPWVLNEDVDLEDIGAYSEYENLSESSVQSDAQQTRMSKRILTNHQQLGASTNIVIEKYKWITNNKSIRENGAANQYMIGSAIGYNDGANGGINQHDIEIQEDTPDGMAGIDNYNFQKSSFLGFEMGNAEDGNTPVLVQEQIRNSYFRKIRQKRLKVELKITNFSLQRGTLVYLYIVEYNDQEQRRLLSEEQMQDPEIKTALMSGSTPFPNQSMNGLYYIDGMEFTYSKHQQQIIQSLYLIKKDPYENINSKTNPDITKET